MIPHIPVRAWIIGILTALTGCGLVYMAAVGGYAWTAGQYATATLYARLLPVVIAAWVAACGIIWFAPFGARTPGRKETC